MVDEVVKKLSKCNNGVEFDVCEYNKYTSLPIIEVHGASIGGLNLPSNMKLDGGGHIIYIKEGIRFKYPIIPYPKKI